MVFKRFVSTICRPYLMGELENGFGFVLKENRKAGKTDGHTGFKAEGLCLYR